MPHDLNYFPKSTRPDDWQDRLGDALHTVAWILFGLALTATLLADTGITGFATEICCIAAKVFSASGALTGMLAVFFGRSLYLIVFFAHLLLTTCAPILEFG